ncbi:unnamed protein product, partial [Protopolystoma xenopodis]
REETVRLEVFNCISTLIRNTATSISAAPKTPIRSSSLADSQAPLILRSVSLLDRFNACLSDVNSAHSRLLALLPTLVQVITRHVAAQDAVANRRSQKRRAVLQATPVVACPRTGQIPGLSANKVSLFSICLVGQRLCVFAGSAL